MALSGTINGSVSMNADKLSFYANWSATQSISGNYSDVTVTTYWRTNNTRWNFDTVGSRNASISINGNEKEINKVFSIYWDRVGNPYGIMSHTVRVYHNQDGTKSISIQASANGTASSYGPGQCSASATVTLNTIPRAASLTSVPDFTDNSGLTISYSNPAGSAAKLYTYIEVTSPASRPIAERGVSGSSYTYKFTEDEKTALRKLNTSSNTQKVRVVLKTVISGNTFYDWEDVTLSIAVVLPKFSPTVTDVNPDTVALTGNASKLILGHSTAKVTVGASAANFASIKAGTEKVTNSGETKGTGEEFQNVKSNIFVLTATDTRGNIGTAQAEVAIVPYIPLSCEIGDTAPAIDGSFVFSISGSYFGGNFGAKDNTLKVEMSYGELGGQESGWMEVAEVVAESTYYTAGRRFQGLDYKKTYVFKARATDALGTTEIASRTIKTYPIWSFGEKNFDINVPLKLEGGLVTWKKKSELTDNDYVMVIQLPVG